MAFTDILNGLKINAINKYVYISIIKSMSIRLTCIIYILTWVRVRVVGVNVGCIEGSAEGNLLGMKDGEGVGSRDGATVGSEVGKLLGSSDGKQVGENEGQAEGV